MSELLGEGPIAKMRVTLGDPVDYVLPIGGASLAMNALLGEPISIEFLGAIECVHCGRRTRRSFNQGYCYPCFKSLAQCDLCVVRPELCHFAQGTCREPDWGRTHCLRAHSVYLANASGLKVGITRGTDPTTRWIDQGATQGLVIRSVEDRLRAGQLEVALKQFAADRTDWRRMLRGQAERLDLVAERDRLWSLLNDAHPDAARSGASPLPPFELAIHYPVYRYPSKPVSHNLDRTPVLSGRLDGIKGQYLILGETVINLRRFAGYRLRVTR
ncbi:MAG: DUF2797 domain-containing protein [Gammaproteobacteria bacterium]|nr:DUF2797 domain-containing protein [Gammaproteobacteria bacterium]